MAGEFVEFFEELLTGSGAWIGFLLIISMILLVTYKVKHSAILFLPVTILIGVFYLNNISVNENIMWCGIIMFLMPIYLAFRLLMEE